MWRDGPAPPGSVWTLDWAQEAPAAYARCLAWGTNLILPEATGGLVVPAVPIISHCGSSLRAIGCHSLVMDPIPQRWMALSMPWRRDRVGFMWEGSFPSGRWPVPAMRISPGSAKARKRGNACLEGTPSTAPCMHSRHQAMTSTLEAGLVAGRAFRSEEHTSELQSH